VIQATLVVSESRDAGMAWKAAALIGSNFTAYMYHDCGHDRNHVE